MDTSFLINYCNVSRFSCPLNNTNTTTEIIGISRGEVIDFNKEYLIFQKDAAYDDERERWYAPKIIIKRSEIQRGFDVEKGKRLKIKYMYKKGEVIERGEETEIRPLQILEISNLE